MTKETLGPPPVPAVLRLVQTVVVGRWRATGEELYREVARLIGEAPGKEVLVVGSGDGVAVEWLAARTGATITGTDPDRARIQRAERRCRELGSRNVAYETAPYEDLPHENAVFDAVIAEPGLASAGDTGRALAEIVRVAKPFGVIVLLQPTWTSELDAPTREMLVERLGLRPHRLMEWKSMLRDAGVVEIQVQDWGAEGGTPRRASGSMRTVAPPPTLAWHQKMHIVGRAWRRWGWREARGALQRETSLLHDLSRHRALGFALMHGVKWPHPRSA
jgi:ubiquinone/menaquinone biosynthesis C-methylase UbiE